jgi:hypothetical protein
MQSHFTRFQFALMSEVNRKTRPQFKGICRILVRPRNRHKKPMSLLAQWRTAPDQLTNKLARQVIAFAGDGRLRDGNATSFEFHDFLVEVPSAMLARYASECLSEAFADSGLVLQDVVNEIGRRLGFIVSNGRYRGTTNQVGNDGLWVLGGNRQILVEVKTTDAYRIDLDRIAQYRRELIKSGKFSVESSSILVVVGRTDTGDLEAQIRGSKHAWEMRLISVDSLVKLMTIKESIDEPETLRRVHEILVPREFTKLDEIVELVFSTAEDAKSLSEFEIQDDEPEGLTTKNGDAPKFMPVAFNDACATRIGLSLNTNLLKRTRTFFSSSDNQTRVVCLVSKEHDGASRPNYWFAFHPHQVEQLSGDGLRFISFGCGSASTIIMIPIDEFSEWLEGMNVTRKEEKFYWHVQIYRDAKKFVLIRRQGQPKIDLTKYLVRT